MKALYLVAPHAYAGIADGLLYVKTDEKREEYRIAEIGRVVAFGNIAFSAQAVTSLLYEDIPVVFLSMRGSYKGTLHKPSAKNVRRRLEQYRRADSKEARLAAAKRIVAAKIANCTDFLLRYHRHRPLDDIAVCRCANSVVLDRVGRAESAAELLGLEGFAAKIYYRLLARVLPPDYGFAGRNRRPPKDPVNSMLSFSYTLLCAELQGLCEAHGLDPFMGCYHEPDYGRPSLAADLCEEFRAPAADRFVLHCASRGIVKPEEFFYDGEKGCRFEPEALKRFIAAYERWMTRPAAAGASWRDIMRRQAERMVRYFDGDGEYEPYLYGGEPDDDDGEL